MLTRPEPDTRTRIVETAERYFREIGYQKTTVADIAKALRMSPANVYRFFDSKKAINEAVAERLMGEVEAELRLIAQGEGSAIERLRRLIVTHHQMNVARYTANVRMHEMVEAALTESWNVIQGHIERVNAIFQHVVRDGVASGEFTVEDPDGAAVCAKVALMRFFHPGLLLQCPEKPGPTLEAMTDFVLRALTARNA